MSNRREFLRRAAGVIAGLDVTTFSRTAQQRAAIMPTPRATALMAAFGLKFPIFSAGMGALSSRSPSRTPAVSARSARERRFRPAPHSLRRPTSSGGVSHARKRAPRDRSR